MLAVAEVWSGEHDQAHTKLARTVLAALSEAGEGNGSPNESRGLVVGEADVVCRAGERWGRTGPNDRKAVKRTKTTKQKRQPTRGKRNLGGGGEKSHLKQEKEREREIARKRKREKKREKDKYIKRE